MNLTAKTETVLLCQQRRVVNGLETAANGVSYDTLRLLRQQPLNKHGGIASQLYAYVTTPSATQGRAWSPGQRTQYYKCIFFDELGQFKQYGIPALSSREIHLEQ